MNDSLLDQLANGDLLLDQPASGECFTVRPNLLHVSDSLQDQPQLYIIAPWDGCPGHV